MTNDQYRKGNNLKNLPTTSEPPPKTSETKKDPQERSGDLKRLPRSYMAENPAPTNIEGVGIHLVKLKEPNGQITDAPDGGFKHVVGEAASPTNPKKGRSDKRKINM